MESRTHGAGEEHVFREKELVCGGACLIRPKGDQRGTLKTEWLAGGKGISPYLDLKEKLFLPIRRACSCCMNEANYFVEYRLSYPIASISYAERRVTLGTQWLRISVCHP